MRFCDTHVAALKAVIAASPMEPLMAKTIEDANIKMARAKLGEPPSADNFEPFLFVHNMIVSAAFGRWGPAYMLSRDPEAPPEMDGHRCPICVAIKQQTGAPKEIVISSDPTLWTEDEVFEEWTKGPVGGALEFCYEERILPRPAQVDAVAANAPEIDNG